jgi:RND family efflux transporter MFP subunit
MRRDAAAGTARGFRPAAATGPRPIRAGAGRLAAALIAAGAALPSCGEPPADEPVVRPVRWEMVYATGTARERAFSGTARAGVESRLSFKVDGTVQRVSVKVGDRVKAGDPIARLDPVDYDLRVQDARASLTRAQAEARQAEASYERIMRLYENKNASRADLDAARAASEAAAAAVSSALQKLELAQANRSYTELAAPADGAISDVPVEVNENVRPGQVVAVLSSGSRPEVTATVPEALIGQIREGDPVRVTLDALPGRDLAATITEVGVTATRSGAAFPVTARINDEVEDLRPGMAAEVRFTFDGDDGRERLLIPPSAVLEDRAGRFAFVLERTGDGFGTVHRREVTVGELSDAGLEILDGLADGEAVVTAGVSKVQDGLRVRVPETPGS